jgi:hypothetical protein
VSLRGDNRFSRKDANHEEIVVAYEALYCSVVDLHTVGGGCPDILVGCGGISELVEIKTQDGDLEPNQVTFAKHWRGNPVRIVRNDADVESHVKKIRGRLARV